MFSKKAQTWYVDFFIGTLIFVASLTFFFKADINLLEQDTEVLEDLDRESRIITDFFMNSGYPNGWDVFTVVEIGLSDNNRINETKLDYLDGMEYNTTKSLLKTKYDYYVFFENSTHQIWYDPTIQEGIGKPGVNSTNIIDEHDPSHLVKIIRFTIYKSNPARMVVYLWKE